MKYFRFDEEPNEVFAREDSESYDDIDSPITFITHDEYLSKVTTICEVIFGIQGDYLETHHWEELAVVDDLPEGWSLHMKNDDGCPPVYATNSAELLGYVMSSVLAGDAVTIKAIRTPKGATS